ncbi:hypothetical protein MFM001_05140 [Mycobacterium sp. MFM001]|uniref:PPE domain-containing protein n=1 Tax=Mycobacterium sp. MFM001 TaxID=2049453 RepID=UPI000DA48103|nr:PPE domain-containing protein [Mycobacterium sp. MFM001]GBE64052.1 hypothetical protein MFM001_05140 [Mycobacterium sp. MFM001]
MPDPRWTGPPEAIAVIFETGCPASVVANNAAWAAESACHETSVGLSAVNMAATAASWQGMGASASAAAGLGLNAGLQLLVGWIAEKIAVTQAAVDAFTSARSAVIPSAVCQANRDDWASANATNFFGMRTPEIVALDTEYFGEHWPHNSSVGWGYSGALSALVAALTVPPPVAPMGASPAAPAAAGEAVAQAAAQTGMSDAMHASSQATQTVSGPADATGEFGSLTQPLQQGLTSAVQPLTSLAQSPMQAAQGAASMPQTVMQSFSGMFPAAFPAAPEAVVEPTAAGNGTAGGLGTGTPSTTGGVGAYPGAGLTSYTRPTNGFEPPTGGRPAGLRADTLGALRELHGPTTSPVAGGAPMPLSAGVPAREGGGSEKKTVTRARLSADDAEGKPT